MTYEPAEAATKLKGGNSNWRGPVWFPTTFLMIETLRKLEKAYSGNVRIALREGHDDYQPRNELESQGGVSGVGPSIFAGKNRGIPDQHWLDLLPISQTPSDLRTEGLTPSLPPETH